MLRTNIFLYTFLQIFLFIANPLHAQFFDQNPEILDRGDFLTTYSLLWKEDSLNRDFQRQEDMFLLIGTNYSQFVSKNFLLGSLQGRRMEKEGKLDEFLNLPSDQKFRARFVYSIYKDNKSSKIIYLGHVLPIRFKYEEDMSEIKWTLRADTSRVMGYFVNQAFTDYGGRKWVAWYSTDLPFNDGPYKFNGLPGLILKMNDLKEDYIFEAVKIEKLKEPMDIELSERDVVATTRQSFLKAEDNLRYDIINRIKESGTSNDIQQRAAKSMLRKNNPIELK
ncbi:MAG: GLPGLI family protein [Lentimicrobium sp.]|nr:GLPGLI family protein [Lentimicrobium sp.]